MGGDDLGEGAAPAGTHPLAAAFAAKAEHWERPACEVGALDAISAGGMRPAADLFRDEPLIERLLSFMGGARPPDRKGLGAYLVMTYAGPLSTAIAPVLLGRGVVPLLDPARLGIRLGQRTVTRGGQSTTVPDIALRFPEPFLTDSAEAAAHPLARRLPSRAALLDALRGELERHFMPLIEALHDKTGLARSAMWRLVGDSLAANFLDVGRTYGGEAEARAAALDILKADGSPLANKELHYFSIDIRDPAGGGAVIASRTFRSRGGCCRYYTAEGGGLCSTCVLQKPQDRDRILESRLRRRIAEVGGAVRGAPG